MTSYISYKDADIYYRDLVLFRAGGWLNDACINYCLKVIEDSLSDILKLKIILMDPSVCSFLRLQCIEEDEFEDMRISLNISSKEWILLPINDNESFESSSSHWSTLVCHIDSKSLWHYDSFHGQNIKSAKNISYKLSQLLHW
jgi:Ulp1 family protease